MLVKFATMFGIGNARRAPGTFGALAAALLGFALLLAPFGWLAMACALAVLTWLGTRASSAYMRAHTGAHDPSAIVVDEWAGQWLTYSVWHAWLFVMAGNTEVAMQLLQEVAASPAYLALGFVLFRFFDILKPWPIRWADRKVKGGFGVMFDDLLAGIAAGTVLYAIYAFAPLLFGTPEEFQV